MDGGRGREEGGGTGRAWHGLGREVRVQGGGKISFCFFFDFFQFHCFLFQKQRCVSCVSVDVWCVLFHADVCVSFLYAEPACAPSACMSFFDCCPFAARVCLEIDPWYFFFFCPFKASEPEPAFFSNAVISLIMVWSSDTMIGFCFRSQWSTNCDDLTTT